MTRNLNPLHSTEHILKQVEYYYKLKNERKCKFIAMEYYDCDLKYRFDVYGELEDGHKIVVEIGDIDEQKFRDLFYDNSIEFIYVPLDLHEYYLGERFKHTSYTAFKTRAQVIKNV